MPFFDFLVRMASGMPGEEWDQFVVGTGWTGKIQLPPSTLNSRSC